MNAEGADSRDLSTGTTIDSGLDWRQVQCQQTRQFIPMNPEDLTVMCPWCEEHETYQRLDTEHEAWRHVELATHICRVEFGVPADGVDVVVWLGESPETVFEKHLDRFNIYLGRGSDRWQYMYSGSHEAFHRVCSHGKNASHWVDEMFAVMFSLLYLERIGEVDHADRNRIGLVEQASLISREEMLNVVSGSLPDGLYGRAYLVGEELRRILGWAALKSLAVTPNARWRSRY
ncbi:MAG TPA: hypothetical protein VFP21_00740 [Solirubrobacterales bacterium]|nr:hypothetical protein [Solirubrobacterales bacterium]